LPDPVGAAIRVSPPARMRGHPSAWGAVGPSGKRRANQEAMAGWKPASAVLTPLRVPAGCVGGNADPSPPKPVPSGQAALVADQVKEETVVLAASPDPVIFFPATVLVKTTSPPPHVEESNSQEIVFFCATQKPAQALENCTACPDVKVSPPTSPMESE